MSELISDEKLYKKKWIEPGLEVVHKGQLTYSFRLSKIKMKVEKIVTRRVMYWDETLQKKIPKNFIEGVRCYWFDNQGEYKVAMFMTKDLVPYILAVQGLEVVNDWIQRKSEVDGRG